MKNKCQFAKVLALLSLFLIFSPPTHAQSTRNPETDLSITQYTQDTTLYVTVKTKSPGVYECVRVEFDLYDRPDRRPPGAEKKHLGVVSVEAPMRNYGEYSTWEKLPKEARDAEAIKKAVSECWESAARQSVTVYEDAKFGGRSKSLGVGKYTLSDFNDLTSSIKVPTGLVAVVYEDADAGGGYGRYVDFLENQPDLTKYNFDNQISHIEIFPSGRQWVRNTINNGRFEAGHSIAGKRWATPNANPQVAPPKPPNIKTPPPSPPPPALCSITGQIKNYSPIYKSVFTLFLYRDGTRQFSIPVTGGQYTIPNVPEGDYEIRGAGFYQPNKHAIFAEGSQEVMCRNGRANSVNFRIDSGD